MNRPLSTAEEAAAIRRGELIDTATRDYFTTTGTDGTMLDHPVPADCHACGRPMYYDSTDERWHHATAPEVACRYLPSEPRRDIPQPVSSEREADPSKAHRVAAGPPTSGCARAGSGVCLAWKHDDRCIAASRGDVLHASGAAWVVIAKYQPDNEANDGSPAVSVHPAAEPAFDSAASTLAAWLRDCLDDEDAGSVERSDGESSREWYGRLADAWDRQGADDQYVRVVRAQQAADGIASAIGRAGHAVAAYRVSLGDEDRSEPIDTVLGDLFTDLRHWADAAGADIYAVLERSYDPYLEERRDPAYAAPPPCPHCGAPLIDPDGTGWAERCHSCDGQVWFCSGCGTPARPADDHACESSDGSLPPEPDRLTLDQFPPITSRLAAARFLRACVRGLGGAFALERPADSYMDHQGRRIFSPDECETFHDRRREAIVAFADAGEDASTYCLALLPPGGAPTGAVYDLDPDTLDSLLHRIVAILNRQGWHAHIDYGPGPTDIYLMGSTGHVLGFTIGDSGVVFAAASEPNGDPVESADDLEPLWSYRPTPLTPAMSADHLAVIVAAQIAVAADDFTAEQEAKA